VAFLSRQALLDQGFRHVGENVQVSESASIHGKSRISIGDRSRIDDFCVISAGEGGIEIGKNIHIACHCSVIGSGMIVFEDFSGTSSRVSIYSSNDDYSGTWMTNPTVSKEFTGVRHGAVTLGRHSIIGSGAIILPEVTIHEGAAVGALSLVTRDCEPWWIYTGVPAKKAKERSRRLLELEPEYLRSLESPGG